MEIPVQSIGDDQKRPEEVLGSPQAMKKLIQDFLREEIWTDQPLESILETSELVDQTTGKVLGRTPAYEMRYRYMRWNHNTADKVSRRSFFHIIRSNWHDLRRQLQKQQPGGDWRIVAARIRDMDLHEVTRQRVGDLNVASAAQLAMDPGMNNQYVHQSATKFVQGSALRAMVDLAVVDVVQAEPVDNLWELQQRGGSAISRYIEVRALRNLPRRLKWERETAESIIRDFMAAQELSGPAEQPPGYLSAEQLDLILELYDGGRQWAEIGGLFGLPWQTVRARAVEHRKAQEAGAAE